MAAQHPHRSNAPRRIFGVFLQSMPSGLHGAVPSGTRYETWQALMGCATDADAPEVQALAGVLATAFDAHGTRWLPITGLGGSATRRLMARWFPGADGMLDLDWRALEHADRSDPRHDEIEDLVALLMDNIAIRPRPRDEALWLAHALAQSSLGDNHLWQDLHLPSRRVLSELMTGWFPALAAKNDRDMKWKKFLYKQLCDKAELSICRAPSCSVCSDRALCFGSEDAVAA